MKETQINEENIRNLLDTFYAKVICDNQLSSIFLAAIDQSNWEEHLKTMCDFWSAVMLGTRRYYGNPILKHQLLPSFDSALFSRWLQLFEETAYQIYSEEIAMLYIDKSKRIAENLKRKIYLSESHL